MPRGRKKKVEETEAVAEAPAEEVTPETEIATEPSPEPTGEPEVPVIEPEAPIGEAPVVEATEVPAPEPEVILPELEVTERALPFGGVTHEVAAPDGQVYEVSNLPTQYRDRLPEQCR